MNRRPASEADTEFARRVHHLAYRDVVTRQFGEWNEEAQDGFFERDWLSAPFEIVLKDGEPCGYLSVEERPNEIHLRELVLHPDFHNQGIGTALLREVMARARVLGLPVRLQTHIENVALRLYLRVGFLEIGRTPTHIQLERLPPK